jgi:anti-anti-sigma regulatory factor
MRIFTMNQDMDHFGMSQMRTRFEDLAQSAEGVCLDLSRVRFLDSAGVDGIAALFDALRARSLDFRVIHAGGQPLQRLQASPVGWLVS